MFFLFKFIIILLISFISNGYTYSQKKVSRILFFNAENYFDPFDDPKTNDNEFLPSGSYHWTWKKFEKKRNDLGKVIIAAGEGKIPAIVGLCEIENRFVLNQLAYKSPLEKFGYKIIHKDSPDQRGIDVAMLYNPECFKLLHTYFYEISEFKTRDILYAKGILCNADTVHFFVNHFPSKRGGAKESNYRRKYVATVLKAVCDSILNCNKNANIILMGDFNDTPNSTIFSETLKATDNFDKIDCEKLYNMALPLAKKGKGTLKFRGVWEIIDLMFISCNLLNPESKISCTKDDFKIFSADFLLEKDNMSTGKKPKRTHVGMKYNDGISDHLPVYLDLKINSQ